MVRELLQFGKREAAKPTSIDPVACIQEFLAVLQASVGNRHTLRFDGTAHTGKILIDRNRYTRIILNLCVNARDAMPEGGEIQIAIGSTQAEDEPGNGTSKYVTVAVRDSGVGMDSKTLKRIFEPYFTTKAKGTGIGLALVKKFTEEAGGFVRIDSALGAGTNVRLFFPRISGKD